MSTQLLSNRASPHGATQGATHSATRDGTSGAGHAFKLIGGSANRVLAEEIARCLGVELCRLTCTRFADGEIFVRIDENVRGMDVFVVQPTNAPADNVMELLLIVDAARRASAARITVVMPYYGYSRQDRKDQPRVAIGAKLVANVIQAAGADRVLGIDFHQHQLQGFFDIPVDHLYAKPVLTNHYKRKRLADLVVVAPDVGAAKMARGFAKQLDAAFAIMDKRRPKANVAEVLNVIGEVDGRPCLIVDDMIDTAGTVAEASRALLKRGAREVYVCATHALLSGPARERLSDAPVVEVTVTDTIAIPPERRFDKLHVLSVGELLAKAIRFTHSDQSVSSLFE